MYDPIFKIWKTCDDEKRLMMIKGLEDWIARQPVKPVKAVALLEKMIEYCETELDKK